MSDSQDTGKEKKSADTTPWSVWEERMYQNMDEGFTKKKPKKSSGQDMLRHVENIVRNPEELQKIIGVKTVADVYKTLDKMQLRREYHDSLARHGIDFDFIVDGLKNIAIAGFKDSDKVKALQVLLKSLGMDKYDQEGAMGGGSWEEVLLEKLGTGTNEEAPQLSAPIEYTVVEPPIPESMKKLKKSEADALKGIYGDKHTTGEAA